MSGQRDKMMMKESQYLQREMDDQGESIPRIREGQQYPMLPKGPNYRDWEVDTGSNSKAMAGGPDGQLFVGRNWMRSYAKDSSDLGNEAV